jgi:hypothetical protein
MAAESTWAESRRKEGNSVILCSRNVFDIGSRMTELCQKMTFPQQQYLAGKFKPFGILVLNPYAGIIRIRLRVLHCNLSQSPL